MYLFVVIALVVAAVWLFVERPSSLGDGLVCLGVLSYAGFAVLSGAFWVLWPQATGQLVPGHTGGMLVVTVTQARGLVVVALGIVCLVERNPRRTAGSGLLLGPMIYNLLMSGEALAAQFTELATPERWLYVTFHFLWGVCFAIRVRDQHSGAAGTALVHTPEAHAPEGARRSILLTFALLVGGLGLFLLAIPYGFQTPTQSSVASSYIAHATHGFGSALMAAAALALAVSSQGEPAADLEHRGTLAPGTLSSGALIAICLGVAALALVRAAALGPMEPVTRGFAFVCILGGGALCLTGRRESQ